jgi:glycosyltransferase involved in cell wall biosynthesis
MNLPECDIFHGLSGSAFRSGSKAKKRGTKYICDRGSSHIRFQNEIMREEYELQGLTYPGIDPRVIDTEEAEYDLADAITVPSQFAKDTFVAKGISEEKLHVVAYGVELSRFLPVSSPPEGEFRVLFAGNISARKGIRYLVEAFQRLVHPAKKLILAGGIRPDLEPLLRPLRGRQEIVFTGHLPQSQLIRVMSESHVLVLPSVEEGLALVQAQAMACGCPVISSTNTGASDLIRDEFDGFIVPIRDSGAIHQRLQRLADDPQLQFSMRQRALASVTVLGGWDHYGQAMYEAFQSVLNSHPVAA